VATAAVDLGGYAAPYLFSVARGLRERSPAHARGRCARCAHRSALLSPSRQGAVQRTANGACARSRKPHALSPPRCSKWWRAGAG